MTKLSQIYREVISNISKFSHRNQQLSKKGFNKAQRLCYTIQQDFNISMPIFETYEEIREFLTGERGRCVCGNFCNLQNRNLGSNFLKFCSKECEKLSISERQTGKSNTVYLFKDRPEYRKRLSEGMKKSIREGRFTPNITNSWCHSRTRVDVNGKVFHVRSSWEKKFLEENPHLEYEKVRIPYIGSDNEIHNYIVDFVDEERKTLYEIKPRSEEFKNHPKYLAAIDWCKANGYEYVLIDKE